MVTAIPQEILDSKILPQIRWGVWEPEKWLADHLPGLG